MRWFTQAAGRGQDFLPPGTCARTRQPVTPYTFEPHASSGCKPLRACRGAGLRVSGQAATHHGLPPVRELSKIVGAVRPESFCSTPSSCQCKPASRAPHGLALRGLEHRGGRRHRRSACCADGPLPSSVRALVAHCRTAKKMRPCSTQVVEVCGTPKEALKSRAKPMTANHVFKAFRGCINEDPRAEDGVHPPLQGSG
jgi:hypothetical protein